MADSVPDDSSVYVEPLATVRQSYYEDKTKPIEFRIAQLNRLKEGVTKYAQQLAEGVKKDMERSLFLTLSFEVGALMIDLDYQLAHIREWTAPEAVDTPMIIGPGNSYILHEPLGVALIMGAWNFSAYTCLRPLMGAITAGNVAIIKPSEMSPASSAVVWQIVTEFLDQSCYICVQGGPQVASAIIKENWDLIVFTGSTAKGKMVAQAAAENLTPTILELGGKCPAIVDETADLQNAALRIVQGKFANCGQVCVSPDFVIVHQAVKERFVEQLTKTIREFFGPNPKESPDYSRMINEGHTKRVAGLLEGHGGEMLMKGDVDVSDQYIGPSLILNPDKSSPLYNEEIFGPVLPIYTVASIEEAITHCKNGEKPLVVYHFSTSKAMQKKVINATHSGAYSGNDCVFHLLNMDLPFGGVGCSGQGRYQSKIGFMNMTNPKAVMTKGSLNIWPLTCRYPPSTPDKQAMFFRLAALCNFNQSTLFRRLKQVGVIAALGILYYKGYLEWTKPIWENVSTTVMEKYREFAPSS